MARGERRRGRPRQPARVARERGLLGVELDREHLQRLAPLRLDPLARPLDEPERLLERRELRLLLDDDLVLAPDRADDERRREREQQERADEQDGAEHVRRHAVRRLGQRRDRGREREPDAADAARGDVAVVQPRDRLDLRPRDVLHGAVALLRVVVHDARGVEADRVPLAEPSGLRRRRRRDPARLDLRRPAPDLLQALVDEAAERVLVAQVRVAPRVAPLDHGVALLLVRLEPGMSRIRSGS